MLKKRSISRSLLFIGIFLFLIGSAFSPMAQEEPGSPVLDNILELVAAFATLAGVSALIGVIVAFLRRGGVIGSDDLAARITAGLNLAAFIILALLGVFRPDLSLDFLDSVAAQIATIALFVLGFIVQMTTPAPVFRAFFRAGVPVLGAVGEQYEARAHYVTPPANYTVPKQEVRQETTTPPPTPRDRR